MFEAVSTLGHVVKLEEFRGRYLVVFFYPKAFTPGCTREAKQFRDNHAEILALGAEVIGISVDDPTVQCEFAREMQLEYPLVADTDRQISTSWGVLRGLLPFDKRVTFVLGPDGTVSARFHHELQIDKHADDALRFLRATMPGKATA